MRRHVVHLVTSFDMGGLQNGIVNIINHGDDSRFRHTVLSIRPQTALGERLEKGEVASLNLSEGRHRGAWKLIGKRLKQMAPDILHTRNWGTYPDGILAARRAGVRCRIHGFHGRDLSNARGEGLKRRVLGKILSLATDKIITLTPSMKEEYRRDYWVSDSRIEVIPNGIDLGRLDSFDADPRCRSTFTVACVGRLDAVKNWPLLLEGFLGMKSREVTDRLVIAGEGPERQEIEGMVEKAGLSAQVLLLGARKDAPAVMKAADVYVQPSHYEGMSNTIVEAMACGVPVIATDVGGNGDVAGRQGTALLIPAGDAAALAQALDRLRRSPDERVALAESGRTRVIERFGLAKMVHHYEAVYSDTLAKTTTRRPVK